MRSILMTTLCSLFLLALGACASSTTPAEFADIEVEAKTNPKVDLTPYTTYAWALAAAAVRDPDGEWTPPGMDIGAEIKFLADRELRAHGRTQVVASPDMLAIFAVGVDMKAIDVTVDEDTKISTSETTPRAGVSIVLVDPETRRAVWIGRALGKVNEGVTLERAKRRLDHAIKTMFADFPR